MNGLELYEHLREIQILKDIPVFFISANAPTAELEKRHLYSLGKPFEMEELLQTIEGFLGK